MSSVLMTLIPGAIVMTLCPLLRTFILFLDDDVINFDDVNPLAIVLALCPCVPELERSSLYYCKV